MSESPLIIGIRQRPTLGKGIVLSFQHVFAMFGATVLVPILTGLPISTSLLASGIGTLIYILCTGAKVPVYLGSSFAYITAITAALAISTPDGSPNIAAAATALMVVGLTYLVVAIVIKFVGKDWLHKLLPPIVIGPMITVIGLGLASAAINMTTFAPGVSITWQSLVVTLVALLGTALMSVRGKGFFRIVPIIAGIGIAYAAAIVIDLISRHALNVEDAALLVLPALQAIGADIGSGLIFEAPKILLPFGEKLSSAGPFQFYSLNFAAALAMIPLAFVTMSEHIGDHTVLGKICDRDFLQDPGLDKTLTGDGIATFIAGMIGGPANTTYGENTGVVGLTRVGSVYVTGGAAIIAIAMSFLKPVKDFIGTIPLPIMGGISIILFGFIASNGIRVLAESGVKFGEVRNIIIPAVMLVLGLGGAVIPINSVSSLSGMAIAMLAGVILNFLLPAKKVDKGENVDESIVINKESVD